MNCFSLKSLFLGLLFHPCTANGSGREDWNSVQPWGATDHLAWEGHTQPTLLPFHKQAQEPWWNRAVPDSPWHLLERKNVTGSQTAFQEQQQRKNTQPTLGQLGQAVNGINKSQGATEPNSTGNPLLPIATYSRKTWNSVWLSFSKKWIKKRIVHVTEGTQSFPK